MSREDSLRRPFVASSSRKKEEEEEEEVKEGDKVPPVPPARPVLGRTEKRHREMRQEDGKAFADIASGRG